MELREPIATSVIRSIQATLAVIESQDRSSLTSLPPTGSSAARTGTAVVCQGEYSSFPVSMKKNLLW